MASEPSLHQTVKLLKSARERRGLSQRALAAKIGVPQSHLSKIESGGVDLQTSSLIQLARALDLEMVLVPRRLLPAIAALQRQSEPDSSHPGIAEPGKAVPAYQLNPEDGDG
jgi:transcriptional regulator with XRE-family HTH domain